MLSCRKLMLALASCIFVASCSKEENGILPQSEGDVVFTASMKTVARATETSFEEGDKIGVYAVSTQANTASQLLSSGNYADNVCYTYRDGMFVNQQGIVRPTDGGLRYYAVYPYTTPCGATFRFSVKTGQLHSGQYTQSDLCTAVSDITAEKEVDLVFSHRLSHVVVNLEGEALGTGRPTVKLNNVNTGCDVDLNANTFTAYESRATVTCAENGTNSYKAIIVPQTIEAGSAFLTVTLNGKEYVLKAASDIRLASGKQQVFNLVIEKDEIVSFSGEILPWGENTEPEQKKVGIYSLDDLVAFRDARNAGEDISRWKDEDGEINIYVDIDMNSIEYWEPISKIEYDEILNGNGHTIRLKMVKTMRRHDDSPWGFIYKNMGEIKNMNLESYMQIESEKEGVYSTCYSIGGLCQQNNGKIKESSVLLLEGSKMLGNLFGGIAGSNYGTIEYCIATGTMEINTIVGGICGDNYSIIKSCTNKLYFSSSNETGYDCVGGIAAYNRNTGSLSAEIYDCTNEADITYLDGGRGAGGIVGRMFSGKVEGCINKGTIVGYKDNHFCDAVGGIVGNASEKLAEQGTRTIKKCTNQGHIFGKAGKTGGIVGAIAGAESVVEDCIYEGTVNDESASEANAIGEDLR